MSIDSYSLTYLLVIILSLTFQSLSSIPLKIQQSGESFIQNHEEFIPTNEWQIVKEGQAIPPGLHVRLNLQTGLREAKLLEDTKEKIISNDIISISSNNNEQEQISKKNLERAFANLDLSKDDIKTDKKHEEEIKKKFRPYDELKKDFQSMNIKIQTDHEILTNLINELTKTNNEHNLKTILTDLEFYLHQYDNAIVFSDMNGLELLIQLLNTTNTYNDDIRSLTSLALGAAFQGNPKVQLKGLNLGFVRYLLHLLNIETNNNIKYRLLFTLSTLLRNFPQAQINFLEYGGIETIINIFEQNNSNNKIKLRAILLMNDLIIEKDQAMNDKQHIYENIHIRDELVKYNWCSYISHYLISIDLNDFDQIDKLLIAMISLTDVCRNDFVSLVPILDKLNDIYTTTNPNEYSTYMNILTNIQKFRKNLLQISSDL
ncbi:unnamed protein product [Rotaria sp. Silwood1]|nr:unnamed protein product [Rotaria sp. Silwood1]CAF3738252.1 unnamed protein product [Rotaria sp. Silwood1]CAF4883531.1 unnamed protein product [Rotaria sp. Silwood1]